MGKPFASEISCLPDTYHWACSADITALQAFVRSSEHLPLMAVGSGGSLTAAFFAALLHQQQHGQLAKASTPLEILSSPTMLSNAAVLLLTAGGGNPDVLAGFRRAATAESRYLAAVCMRRHSPLEELSRNFSHYPVFEYEPPCGKDGFLATNSLLGLLILLARSYYSKLNDLFGELPVGFPDVEARSNTLSGFFSSHPNIDTFIALHGTWGMPIAMDLESKFSEAALGHVHVADYRNFAHGRHHWLAKRGFGSCVLAFITPEDKSLAYKTLALLPPDIAVIRVETDLTGPAGVIELFLQMVNIVHWFGMRQSIDPGKPGVPDWGRRIYHLRTVTSSVRSSVTTETKAVCIRRKCSPRSLDQLSVSEVQDWEKAYNEFTTSLSNARFSAVVLDYDGTLCSTAERYTGIRASVREQLIRLLDGGITIGIATGRGKSVQKAMAESIPDHLLSHVHICYYNGGIVSNASEPLSVADKETDICNELAPLSDDLKTISRLSILADVKSSYHQITLIPKNINMQDAIIDIVRKSMEKHKINDAQILTSSHSVDVLAPYVSKRRIVDHFHELLDLDGMSNVLCIGDKGRWPGNDFYLLQEPYSLSVEEVSPDPSSCWNLAPAGIHGVDAALLYLSNMKVHRQKNEAEKPFVTFTVK